MGQGLPYEMQLRAWGHPKILESQPGAAVTLKTRVHEDTSVPGPHCEENGCCRPDTHRPTSNGLELLQSAQLYHLQKDLDQDGSI